MREASMIRVPIMTSGVERIDGKTFTREAVVRAGKVQGWEIEELPDGEVTAWVAASVPNLIEVLDVTLRDAITKLVQTDPIAAVHVNNWINGRETILDSMARIVLDLARQNEKLKDLLLKDAQTRTQPIVIDGSNLSREQWARVMDPVREDRPRVLIDKEG